MTERQTILIVDDRKENLVALRRVLADLDVDIVEATSGNAALAATIDRNFAVAILDVQMPGMSGYELAEHLRGDESTKVTPIVFVTASSRDERSMFEGYDAGGVDYIVKPYEPRVLLGKVRVFLELDRSRRELRHHRDRLKATVKEQTARLQHLNDVLRAIRNVNQLIVREKDPEVLVQQACELLVETRSYLGACVTLTGDADAVGISGSAGWNGEFERYKRKLGDGWEPPCVAIVGASEAPVAVPVDSCRHCPLHLGQGGGQAVATGVRHGDRTFGFLTVTLGASAALDNEEAALIHEVAGDLGLALSSIATSRRVEELSRFPAENPNPVLRVSLSGGILYANAAAEAILATLGTTTDGKLPAGWSKPLKSAVESDQPVVEELEANNRVYSAAFAPVQEHHYINIYMRDVTEEKQAAASLQASEERFRRSIQKAPFPAMVHAEDGEILLVNNVWTEITGYGIAEIPTIAAWTERAYGKASEQVRAQIGGLYGQDGRADEGEYTVCCKDGSTRTWAFASTPLGLNPAGRLLVLSMAMDITERQGLESQLRQAQKLEAIGQLAGGVAHDFNNLLMGIMNYVELCRDGLEADHPVREWLDEITTESQRSADIVRQLLAFSRKQTIAPCVLDLNDTVAGMLQMLRRLIGEDIDLSWRPGAAIRSVMMDPTQVDQILANLCVNARDAIGGVGKITIETEHVELGADYCTNHIEAVPGDYTMLAVSDTGAGMDAETRARIFEPFFTTKAEGKGTGLGLATVYGIVKQNNGSINVYSEPGEGTTFRIYLPCSEETADSRVRMAVKEEAPGGTETVLLVEDEKSIRVTTRIFLEQLGYTVFSAETPAVALKTADEQAGKLNLLITDVVMPGMSGKALAQQLKPGHPDMKVLYMSGYTANAIAHHGVLDEGVEFLSKPITRDQLARKLREVLDG